jgi:hypothetical protein
VPFLGFKTRRDREWEEVRATAQGDLVTLGEEIGALDLDVQMPDADPDAVKRYRQAVEAYDRANTVFNAAKRPEDLATVSESLEEGRFAMACAQAHLEGRPPPEHRPPCFFDPRHGPSTTDVDWAPPGGAPRTVPACAADAVRIADGFEPHGRQVPVDGRPTDYWNAPGHYGPYSGGYFGGFGGGLLPGLLIGSVLGGAMGFGMGGLFDGDEGGFDGGDDDGGGFDLGGGDFGGGDF